MNAVLETELASALRAIDQRMYEGWRNRLTVNEPDHKPTPSVYVPSQSRLKP